MLLTSATDPGSASRLAEERKIKKYASLADRYHFEPVAFETCGEVGPQTAYALSRWPTHREGNRRSTRKGVAVPTR